MADDRPNEYGFNLRLSNKLLALETIRLFEAPLLEALREPAKPLTRKQKVVRFLRRTFIYEPYENDERPLMLRIWRFYFLIRMQ